MCARTTQQKKLGKYDWVYASSDADYLGNSRLPKINRRMSNLISKSASDRYGKMIAERNSYVSVHPRDVVNTSPQELFYGKNLDRRLYYSYGG